MRIIGQKINLRYLKKTDTKSIYQHVKDENVLRYLLIPSPYRLNHAEDYVKKVIKRRIKKEAYDFGIEDKITGQIVGMISLNKVDWKNKKSEIGYWLGKKYHRQGIMSEALSMMLNFAFNEIRLHKVFAGVMKPNKASANLLKKHGFKYEGCLRENFKNNGRWVDDFIFSILKKEYKK